jgi:hypothetical protein
MENEQKRPPSHEEREVQTLVERIEQMEVTKRSRQRSRSEDNARRLPGKQSNERCRERIHS